MWKSKATSCSLVHRVGKTFLQTLAKPSVPFAIADAPHLPRGYVGRMLRISCASHTAADYDIELASGNHLIDEIDKISSW